MIAAGLFLSAKIFNLLTWSAVHARRFDFLVIS